MILFVYLRLGLFTSFLSYITRSPLPRLTSPASSTKAVTPTVRAVCGQTHTYTPITKRRALLLVLSHEDEPSFIFLQITSCLGKDGLLSRVELAGG